MCIRDRTAAYCDRKVLSGQQKALFPAKKANRKAAPAAGGIGGPFRQVGGKPCQNLHLLARTLQERQLGKRVSRLVGAEDAVCADSPLIFGVTAHKTNRGRLFRWDGGRRQNLCRNCGGRRLCTAAAPDSQNPCIGDIGQADVYKRQGNREWLNVGCRFSIRRCMDNFSNYPFIRTNMFNLVYNML